jgi:hypothetical protein
MLARSCQQPGEGEEGEERAYLSFHMTGSSIMAHQLGETRMAAASEGRSSDKKMCV